MKVMGPGEWGWTRVWQGCGGTTEGGTCEMPAWKREYGGLRRRRRAFWQFPLFFIFIFVSKKLVLVLFVLVGLLSHGKRCCLRCSAPRVPFFWGALWSTITPLLLMSFGKSQPSKVTCFNALDSTVPCLLVYSIITSSHFIDYH